MHDDERLRRARERDVERAQAVDSLARPRRSRRARRARRGRTRAPCAARGVSAWNGGAVSSSKPDSSPCGTSGRSAAGAITAVRPSRSASAAASRITAAASSSAATCDEARRLVAVAVGDRRGDVRRDQREQRQRELHHLPRHAVGEPKLLDLRLAPVGEVRHELVPAVIGDRPRGLGDVAEDRHRAGRAPREHPQLHRRQVLRLVDDDVPVRRRRPLEERARLVEQRQVAVAPAASSEPLRSEHPSDELLRLDARPGRIDELAEKRADRASSSSNERNARSCSLRPYCS